MRKPFSFEQNNFAILTGGPHGRLAGNIAGVVYGAARTRRGKEVTARQKVSPSNPKTSGQMLQRHKFLEAKYAVRHLTASLYQTFFNRAIGQLPGWHSLMSIILNDTNASEEFNTPAQTPLGNLTFPRSWTCGTGAGASKTIDITWDTDLGLNGTANDEAYTFVIQKNAEADYSRPAEYFGTSTVRSDGALTIECDKANEDYQVCLFFVGAGTAVGLLSPATWYEATSKA